MNGKGDKQRPTNKRAFNLSFDRIFGVFKQKAKAPKKPKNQGQQIIEYLKANKTINQMQATNDLQITRLSARVFDLKEKGYEFNRRTVHSTSKTNRPVQYVEWSLKT